MKPFFAAASRETDQLAGCGRLRVVQRIGECLLKTLLFSRVLMIPWRNCGG